MDAIWPLVVGFLLTTVLGGLLGTYLQRRSWEHQNEAQLREAELDKAGQVCQAVSGLLDKRRYRMLRLFHAVRGRAQGTVSADGLADKLAGYDRVLYEWNDVLNVNLAMVATSFGREVWEELSGCTRPTRGWGASSRTPTAWPRRVPRRRPWPGSATGWAASTSSPTSSTS
jgi:hypothetical protein